MASTNTKLCKILESSIVANKRLSLNEQLDFDPLIEFRNVLMYIFYNLIAEFELINTYILFANLPIYLLLHTFIVFIFRRFKYCIYFVI